MLARIVTRLFYALIFFALGVWAAPSTGGLGKLIGSGVSRVTDGAAGLWAAAERTLAFDTGLPAAWSGAPVKPAAPAPTVALAPTVATAPAAQPVAPVATKPAAAPTPAPSALDRARASYGRGDIAGAIRAYEEALAKAPDDIAINGELGNVHWANGRHADAAKAYHRAGVAMVAAKRTGEAGGLVEAIRKGDAALADDLAKRIDAAR